MTSFKTPIQVDKGPFYIPFVDFQPTLDAWKNILVDLGNDTIRPYINTVIVGFSSAVIARSMGSLAAYALVRFGYRPRVGLIVLFVLRGRGLRRHRRAACRGRRGRVASALACSSILAQTIGRRFRRTLGNGDIAFWLISQRILPPIAVVVPLYVLFQQVGLLDTQLALVITYVAANLPIVVWLMRDYFAALPDRARGVGVGRRRVGLPDRPLGRPADRRPGPRRDVPDRADLRLERVPRSR